MKVFNSSLLNSRLGASMLLLLVLMISWLLLLAQSFISCSGIQFVLANDEATTENEEAAEASEDAGEGEGEGDAEERLSPTDRIPAMMIPALVKMPTLLVPFGEYFKDESCHEMYKEVAVDATKFDEANQGREVNNLDPIHEIVCKVSSNCRSYMIDGIKEIATKVPMYNSIVKQLIPKDFDMDRFAKGMKDYYNYHCEDGPEGEGERDDEDVRDETEL